MFIEGAYCAKVNLWLRTWMNSFSWFLGRRRPYNIVFRFRFVYGFMFVYYNCIISVKMAVPWGSLTLYYAIIRFILTYAAIQSSEKYFRTLLRNTKPAQSLRWTFSRRNSQKKSTQHAHNTRVCVCVCARVCMFVSVWCGWCLRVWVGVSVYACVRLFGVCVSSI